MEQVTIHRIPHRHNRGKSGYHFLWIVLSKDGRNLETACSMSEAIHKIESEGWILEPNI
jgi:hypothetical protein